MKDKEKLMINRESPEGGDGNKVFSIRIKDVAAAPLDKLASGSRNELINILLDHAVENCEIRD